MPLRSSPELPLRKRLARLVAFGGVLALGSTAAAERDLFRFAGPPPRGRAAGRRPVAVPAAAVPAVPETYGPTAPPRTVIPESPPPAAPPPVACPWRYVGVFGPEGEPVAALARPGEIVVARAGDRLGDWTVRAVAPGEVELALAGEPDRRERLVPAKR